MIYRCENCGYRFESEKPKRCPYCGEDSVVKEESAEELLENLEI